MLPHHISHPTITPFPTITILPPTVVIVEPPGKCPCSGQARGFGCDRHVHRTSNTAMSTTATLTAHVDRLHIDDGTSTTHVDRLHIDDRHNVDHPQRRPPRRRPPRQTPPR